MLTLLTGQQRRGGVSYGLGTITTLKPADAAANLKACPAVKAVAPESTGSVRVKFQSQNTSTSLLGTTPEYPAIRGFALAEGRFFTATGCPLGECAAAPRWRCWAPVFATPCSGTWPPLGKTVKLNGQSFRVVGTFQAKGGTGFRNPDDQIWVPVTTAMRRVFGRDYLNSMSVQAVSEGQMDAAQQQVEALLRERHKIPAGEPVDVTIRNQADLLETARQQTGIFTLLLASVAGVSLFVGGIGIMNIMLVTVTERTREIGIRKAIGAKTSDIRPQFLIEAVTMSLVGGLLGILFGLFAAAMVASRTGWNTVVTPGSVLLSFGFAAPGAPWAVASSLVSIRPAKRPG